jgi:hypothetical protein
MRSFGETSGRPGTVAQPVSLSVRRERAQARERRTEYLARAYGCRDMAARALDTHDAQFLRAMTIVWRLLADKCAGVPDAAGRSGRRHHDGRHHRADPSNNLPSGRIG